MTQNIPESPNKSSPSKSLVSIWEKEHLKREEQRTITNRNNIKRIKIETETTRTRSSPQIQDENLQNETSELFLLLKQQQKLKEEIKSPKKEVEINAKKRSSITISHQQISTTTQETIQQELDDLNNLMEEGDLDDFFYSSNEAPVEFPSQDIEMDDKIENNISGSDTDETESDVETEEEKEEEQEEKQDKLKPFITIDRTKTKDFLSISKEYQPPLRCLVLEVSTNIYYSCEDKSPTPETTNTNVFLKKEKKRNKFEEETPQGYQKILIVFDENRLLEKKIILRDFWYETEVKVGDYVNIISWSMTHDELLERKKILINNTRNAIILHPDILIPAKTIGSSIQCNRQSVLQQLIRSSPIITEQILKGEIVHNLFEYALLRKNFSTTFLEANLLEILNENILKIYILNKDIEYFKLLIYPIIKSMQKWAQENVHGAIVSRQRSTSMMSLYDLSLVKSIRKILAVEESIWSPLYGIKGKIDATVVYKPNPLLFQKNQKIQSNQLNQKGFPVPFELKTGKNRGGDFGNSYDRAQVSIYSLLFSERSSFYNYNNNNSYFPEGILCYLNENNKLQLQIHSSIQEMQSLIQRRNDIAYYLNQKHQLPKVKKEERICKYCNYQNACVLYHKTIENGNSISFGINHIFSKYIEFIPSEYNSIYFSFFIHWDKFINLESFYCQNLSSSVWNFPSSHQEEQGICASQMKLISSRKITSLSQNPPLSSQSSFSSSFTSSSSQNKKSNHNNTCIGYIYRFEKNIQDPQNHLHDDHDFNDFFTSQKINKLKKSFSSAFLPSPSSQCYEKTLKNLQFSVGDFILLSTEYGHFGVRQGTIRRITDNTMDILLSEMLQAPYYSPSIESLSQNSQTSKSSQTSSNSSCDNTNEIPDIEDIYLSKINPFTNQTLWRIDKLESLSIYPRMRSNLIQLFNGSERSKKLCKLLIEKKSPEFSIANSPCDDFFHSWSQQYPSVSLLNVHQRNAIKHVLSAKDYALILGMPGTGKTSTIAHIVSSLFEKGKKILLTSYTHSAIDNLLLKLKNLKVPFLRLGKEDRIHPEILPYSLQNENSLDSLLCKLFLKFIQSFKCQIPQNFIIYFI